MRNEEYTQCEICGEEIKKGYMTQWRDGKYYCINCQVDLNNKIKHENILQRRKYELMDQLNEIQIELKENHHINLMYV